MTLPKKYFVSYAYADEAEVEVLKETLPPHVEPYTFPPIVVPPDQLVSNKLTKAILACDGLIYIDGGQSAKSFWVAFERDYALRACKKVYSASKTTGSYKLSKHINKPLDLATFASYHRTDGDRVRKISEFLKQERYFDPWLDTDELVAGNDLAREIESNIQNRLRRGGYVIVFWSKAAANSQFVERELQSAVLGMEGANNRVLFALLDDTPLPEFWRSQESGVQIYSDNERTDYQRWDDLIVRLYWLIYKKTEYRLEDGKNA